MKPTLGEFVKQRREEMKLSLSDIARRGKISKAVASLVERDETPNPTIATLDGIARALNIPVETLARLAAGYELSRQGLEVELAAIICDLPPSDQLEILTTIETLASARRKRLGL